MSATEPVEILAVTGGVGGVEAEWAALQQLAAQLDDTGDTARDRAGLGARVLADGDLIASAPYSPATFAAAEGAVLRATVGPDGLLARALAWEATAIAIRIAVIELKAADLVAHEAIEARDHALGQVVAGFGLAGATLALAAAPQLVPLVVGMPPRLRARLGGAVGGRLQQAVVDHPSLVETLVNSSGGLVDGVLGSAPIHRGTPQAADTLAGLYDDGTPAVRARPDVVLPPTSLGRPRDLAGLVTALSGVAGLSVGSSSRLNGTIAVATLRDSHGTRHVVYLPGTDDLATRPWSQDSDVRDMGTNLDLIAGRSTSYGAGVLQAMAAAGVGRHEPVLLVGHSQGGMQAAALAASDPPYDIKQVVTAGSPLAQVDLPADVRTLSLENRGDIVPLTDGEPNRPGVGHVTVSVDAGGDGIVGHHDYDRYVEGAAAADASDDPSVRAALGGLRDDGFLGGGQVEVETRVFQITRR